MQSAKESRDMLDAVVAELDKVEKVQAPTMKGTKADVDVLRSIVADCAAALETPSGGDGGGADDWRAVVSQALDKVNASSAVDRLAKYQRDFHASLSRLTKVVDKSPTAVLTASSDVVVPLSRKRLDRVVAEHLFRSGCFAAAERLVAEAGVRTDVGEFKPFVDLDRIMGALHSGELEPAFQWAQAHAASAPGNGLLDFAIRQYRFLHLLVRNGDRAAALAYARAHFPPCASAFFPDIARAMACMLYYPCPAHVSTPYADYVERSLDLRRIDSLLRAHFCAELGVSAQSPLFICVSAGAMALPVLMRSTGITGKPLGSWLHGELLPIEVDLDKRFRFHSVFACPVTRELATKSNPPKMLPCGHVFSNDSIAGLARPGHRFKCPYCPSHQTTHQVRPVYF